MLSFNFIRIIQLQINFEESKIEEIDDFKDKGSIKKAYFLNYS